MAQRAASNGSSVHQHVEKEAIHWQEKARVPTAERDLELPREGCWVRREPALSGLSA